MNIKQYMTANGYGSGVKLARDLGLSPAYLNQIANGHRMPSLKLASRIIKASNNQITLHGLRPDLELILREQGDGMESQHGEESDMALRKLLEAKDAAVRSLIAK